MRPVVLLAEEQPLTPAATAVLARAATVLHKPLDRAALLEVVGSVDALWVRFAHQIDDELLSAAPRLRAIASPTTGTDHLDVDAAHRRGVIVLSLRGEQEFLSGVRATAEHTMALLLAALRRLPAASAAVRGGQWDRDRWLGREVADSAVGVVGYGRNGKLVTRYLRAFGADVRTHDVGAAALAAAEADAVPVLPLDELLATSDVVTLHVDLNPTTSPLLRRREFALMKSGALLVNTSRGEVVDEDALVAALQSGHLGGAGLDVVAAERRPLTERALYRYLSEHDNVVVTPHIGGWTQESVRKTEVFLAERLVQALE